MKADLQPKQGSPFTFLIPVGVTAEETDEIGSCGTILNGTPCGQTGKLFRIAGEHDLDFDFFCACPGCAFKVLGEGFAVM